MTGFGKNLVKISICLTCGGFYGFEFNWGFFEGFVHSEYLDREILANSVIIRLGFTLFINKLRTASLGLTMSTTWIRIQLSRLFRTGLCSAFDQDILENIQILRWKTDWAIPREIESFVVPWFYNQGSSCEIVAIDQTRFYICLYRIESASRHHLFCLITCFREHSLASPLLHRLKTVQSWSASSV